MKLHFEKPATCWINGVKYHYSDGTHDVPDAVAEVMLEAKLAMKVEDTQRSEDKTTKKK